MSDSMLCLKSLSRQVMLASPKGQRISGALAVKARSTRSGAGRAMPRTVVGHEFTSADTCQTIDAHQPGNPLTAYANVAGGKICMNARDTIGAFRRRVYLADFHESIRIANCASTGWPIGPRIIPAGGDTQNTAHGGDGVGGLVVAHEPEPFGGITSVSRANKAVAFARISRSSFNC